MTEVKVGQRWEYTSSSYHFIVEILKVDSSERYYTITCSVVQSFCAEYKLGYSTSSWKPHEVSGGGWKYLVGQDKPAA